MFTGQQSSNMSSVINGRAVKEGSVLQDAPIEGIRKCGHCGDVIGAYESMVILSDGRAHRTSRAGADESMLAAGECYHAECFAQTHEIPIE